MKRIEVKPKHVNTKYTQKDLENLFNQGYVLSGQVLIKEGGGIATRDNPNAEPNVFPVDVWVRHTGAMPSVHVGAALVEVIETYGETDAIKRLCQLIFGATPEGVIAMMED